MGLLVPRRGALWVTLREAGQSRVLRGVPHPLAVVLPDPLAGVRPGAEPLQILRVVESSYSRKENCRVVGRIKEQPAEVHLYWSTWLLEGEKLDDKLICPWICCVRDGEVKAGTAPVWPCPRLWRRKTSVPPWRRARPGFLSRASVPGTRNNPARQPSALNLVFGVKKAVGYDCRTY